MTKREKIIARYLGKTVHMVVDRPIGYCHGDIVYPINYGYIPGVIAEDGEEQDAYLLGVSEPVSSFDGRVIGVVRRRNDCEDKLVVAPEGMRFHQGEIAEAVHFQEQYFDSSIEAIFQKSCGVIPYRRKENGTEYLVLLLTNTCWSFPKGHMEPGETEVQTALRELFEETGLTATLETGKAATLEYPISSIACKQVVLFPGEVQGEVVAQASEVADYRWVRDKELQALLYPDTYEACAPLLER
jgi:8-oxo-dGTP pyrophosphatase MutT (NUDIX family)